MSGWFSSESASHGLSEPVIGWLNLIGKEFLRLLDVSFGLSIFIQDYLMNPFLLVSRLSSIDQGKVIKVKFDLN